MNRMNLRPVQTIYCVVYAMEEIDKQKVNRWAWNWVAFGEPETTLIVNFWCTNHVTSDLLAIPVMLSIL
jgi:hypothetical protein